LAKKRYSQKTTKNIKSKVYFTLLQKILKNAKKFKNLFY